MAREGQVNVSNIAYQKEISFLERAKEIASNPEITKDECQVTLNDTVKQYERLLDDVKLLTSVGDRLQKKLKTANVMLKEQSDEINRINGDLEKRNIELQQTLDELTRARIGKKATTIIFAITIGLFIFVELLEQAFQVMTNPQMRSHFWTNFFGQIFSLQYGVTFLFKVVLVFLFKPLEGFLEGTLLKRAYRADKEEAAKTQAVQVVKEGE